MIAMKAVQNMKATALSRIQSALRADPGLLESRILIVDDEREVLALLIQIVNRAGFRNVRGLMTGAPVLKEMDSFGPDLVLLDLHLPDMDGLDLLREIRHRNEDRSSFLPVLVLTGDETLDAREEALASGATDFLTKPYGQVEVLLRINNLLSTRSLHVNLERRLERARLEVLERLARAAESHDPEMFDHTTRVGNVAAGLARAAGLPARTVDLIRRAAPLHDVGKIGISDAILQKAGPLTPAEYEEQKRHSRIGAEMLSGSEFPVLQMAEEIALSHHERWDGRGYPLGLSGKDIPLSGRIVGIADVFDALVSRRSYKAPWTVTEALNELRGCAGTQFDPELVPIFTAMIQRTDLSRTEENAA